MKITNFFKKNKSKYSRKKYIFFLEFWNVAPHFQTALELAINHAKLNDQVTFLFGGHDVLFIERNLNLKHNPSEPLKLLPEEAAIRLVKEENIEFHKRINLPKIKIEIPKFNSINELLEFKYKDFLVGRAAASSLMAELGNSNPDVDKYSALIEKIINSGIEVYEFSKSFFSKNQVDLVYAFNGRFCNQAALVSASKSCGIRVLFHERGANQNFYFLEEFIPHDVLKIQENLLNRWTQACAIDKNNAELVAADFFTSQRAGKEIGWLSYTQKQRANTLPHLERGKKIITYFSSCDDEYAALGDVYVWKYWDNQYLAVMDLIKACQAVGNIDLHIRLHPNHRNKDPDDIQKWLDLQSVSGINVILPESEVDTYRLIEESDIVVVAGSTVGIESVYWGTPCINLGPASYSELGAVYHPKNFNDLINFLEREDLIADYNKALPYGFHFNTFGVGFELYKPIDLFSGTFYGQDLTKAYRELSIFEKLTAFFKA